MVELPKDSIRWTHRKKLSVLYAIENKHLTAADAMISYSLSQEEINEWKQRVESEQGLHATRRRIMA